MTPEFESFNLAVVIPALNERPNLERLVPDIHRVLEGLDCLYEILVVDGGSADGTAESVPGLGARVIKQRERGYGGALLAGFDAARAEYIITMDADLSHRAEFIRDLWLNRQTSDILIASRYVAGGRAEMPRSRYWMSVLLNRTYSLGLGLPVRDISSGFRLYRRRAIEGLRPLARDFDIAQELLALAYRRGARVAEIPFHYMPRGEGRSHAQILRFAWMFLRTLFRARRILRCG